MPYELKFHVNPSFVEVISRGKLTQEEQSQRDSEVHKLGRGNKPTFFLYNLLSTEIDASITELYQTPGLLEKEEQNRRNKAALLVQRDDKDWENLKFLETASLNRGWQIRVFSDRDEAISWLTD